MSPLDFIIWSGALATGILIVGFAAFVVGAAANAVIRAMRKR